MWSTFFDHAPIGINSKDTVYGLRDDLFGWKKMELDSTATYGDVAEGRLLERRRVVVGADVARRNPNLYARLAGIDHVDIALRVSIEGLSFVSYKELDSRWRVSFGLIKGYENSGEFGAHFALEGKFLGGTFLAGAEFNYDTRERIYNSNIANGVYAKVLVGWTKPL